MDTNKRSAVRVAGVAVAAATMLALVNPALRAGPSGSAGPRPVHVVAPGETLWSLAERFGGQQDPRNYVDDVVSLNNLRAATLYPGEKITLP